MSVRYVGVVFSDTFAHNHALRCGPSVSGEKSVMVCGVGDTSWRADTRMTTQPCCSTRDSQVGPVRALGADRRPMPDMPRDACPADPGRGQRAFTLLELLIVISIIVILMSMAMPLMTMAGREAKKTATRAVMSKVDAAVRLFRGDLGSYPWQPAYDEPADPVLGSAGRNRLFYNIGCDIAADDRVKVLADAKAAGDIYANAGPDNAAALYYITQDYPPNMGNIKWICNRAAEDRVRLAVLAGNVDISNGVWAEEFTWWDADTVYGPCVVNAKGHLVLQRRTMPQTKLLSSPKSAAKPGWAGDYLVGELESRYINGESILDDWGKPLLYVCQVIEGVTIPVRPQGWMPTMCSARSMGLHPAGRTTIAAVDTVTGLVVEPHPTRFPDLAQPRHSDRRFYAPRGCELEFELWSAGPDGKAEWMRDAAANHDNLSMLPYDKTLP
jgi:prepilin-type N-terminal cleavage/methylation domain-containing protein